MSLGSGYNDNIEIRGCFFMNRLVQRILFILILLFLLFNILILFNVVHLNTRFYGLITIFFLILNLIYFKKSDQYK